MTLFPCLIFKNIFPLTLWWLWSLLSGYHHFYVCTVPVLEAGAENQWTHSETSNTCVLFHSSNFILETWLENVFMKEHNLLSNAKVLIISPFLFSL